MKLGDNLVRARKKCGLQYRERVDTARYAAGLEKLLEELKAERSYSEQDAFLALKDILAGVWKSRQAQPPENT